MSIFFWRRCAGVALLNLIALSVGANDDPLTLAEAQRLAMLQAPNVAASRYARDAASELTHGAGLLPDPVLKLAVENVPVSGPDRFALGNDAMTMTRVGVMQEFMRPSKRRLLAERADQAVAAAEAHAVMEVVNTQRDTALAWLDVYYTESAEHVLATQLARTQEELLAIESAYAQGRGGSADVLAARGALALLQDQIGAAAYRTQAARIELARYVPNDAHRPLVNRPRIDVLPSHVHTDDAALGEQLRSHPDLKVLEREQALADTDVRLARAARRPDISVELSYGRRGPLYDDMVMLAVSMPLQLYRGNRQSREVASRLALASSLKEERESMYREHLSEARMLLGEWNSLRARCANFDDAIVPLARDRTAAAEAAYRGGKVSLEQVAAARRNEVEMQMQALQLEAEWARVWARLSFLSAYDAGEQP